MGKKVYAIKEGFDFKNNKKIQDKIVNTWEECLKYVKCVKGAKYKSFKDIKDAQNYLNGIDLSIKKEENYPKDCLHIYVDGSYNVKTGMYSYAFIAVRGDVVEYIESEALDGNLKNNIRQVAGELKAALKAVEYALKKGDRCVVIFHDYAGVCYHATGVWKRNEKSSEEYYERMQKFMNMGIHITFVKVDSHTGNLYNELADEKCKQRLSIQSDGVVEKWLKTGTLITANESVKREILEIAPGCEKNIL